ncbi:hypothetical protein ABZP36_007052 [Zizania latifolia]
MDEAEALALGAGAAVPNDDGAPRDPTPPISLLPSGSTSSRTSREETLNPWPVRKPKWEKEEDELASGVRSLISLVEEGRWARWWAEPRVGLPNNTEPH